MSLDMLKVGSGVKIEKERDSLGGNSPLKTDIYDFECEYMYLDQTEKGAIMAYGSFKEVESGRSIRFSECIMSKKSGELKATYTDKKTKEEKLLPGYLNVLSLAHAMGITDDDDELIGDLSQLSAEEKTLKLYDRDEQKEMPKEKNVIVEMTGVRFKAAVYEVVETKMDKDAEGKYTVPTAEERQYNDFIKFFNVDGQTNAEAENGEDAAFGDEWLEVHKGKLRDKRAKDAPAKGSPSQGKTVAKKKPLKFN